MQITTKTWTHIYRFGGFIILSWELFCSQSWECEFCGTTSLVECAEGEQPRAADITFLLEAAPPTDASNAEAVASAPSAVSGDDSLVVFAVDVSGSMDSGAGAGTSRLQTAKAAIIKQLDQLENEFPRRRVALLTFSEGVDIYGDGTSMLIHRSLLPVKYFEGKFKLLYSLVYSFTVLHCTCVRTRSVTRASQEYSPKSSSVRFY